MERSDEALVAACRRGDESAWESLVKRYQRLVYSIPRRAGLDEDAAADIFQNVFASLVERLDAIEQPGRVSAWLVTAARRETWRMVLSQKAARSTTSQSEDDEATLDIRDDAPLAEEEILRLEKQHQVRQAVKSLDARCQQLLKLLFYSSEPPSYLEVASELGLPEGSIGPNRARCLQKLLRILKKSGF